MISEGSAVINTADFIGICLKMESIKDMRSQIVKFKILKIFWDTLRKRPYFLVAAQ